MGFLDYINPFNKVMDLVDQVVEDKDKVNEIKQAITMAAEETYRKELDTKTVPWVDALHKMGRQLTSYLGYGLAFYMVAKGFDPMAVMAAVAPGGIYAAFKHKGK
jgi:hypothetical protein